MHVDLRANGHLQTKTVAPGVIGAYHPFGHQVTFLPDEGWRAVTEGRLSSLPDWIVQDLAARHFLVSEAEEARLVKELDTGPSGLGELWLVVVQSCNMACQYCVVEGNVEDLERRKYSKPKDVFDSPLIVPDENGEPTLKGAGTQVDMMSPETALAACDLFERQLQTAGQATPRVTFYGGEPMLNTAAIRAAVPRLRQIRWPGMGRADGPSLLIITNGQIYDAEFTDFLKAHSVMVSVSLDGMKRHHDAVRVNHGGGGTFEKAARSLERYIAAGLSCGICTTIGRHNVDDLPEIADYFAERFGVAVEFQVPFDIGCGGNDYYVPMVEAFPKAMEAYERLRRRGLIEGLAFKRVAEMAAGGTRRTDCSAIGSQITVSPDGAMGPCHSLVGERIGFSGHVSDPAFDPFQTEAFREWAGRYPLNMPDCQGCSAIGICGGGCPYNAMIKKGSIWEKDPQQCSYMHAFVDWFIDDCWGRYQAATGMTVQPAAASATDGARQFEQA
ncbi:MAG: SPASM domain-containing protein [Rhodobacter sp.]|nr:SPASM domain-containing protein [Rhodobacter sp.]